MSRLLDVKPVSLHPPVAFELLQELVQHEMLDLIDHFDDLTSRL